MSASTGATAQKCHRQRTLHLPAPMVMTMSVHHMYMEMIMEELERIADRGQVKMSQIEAKLVMMMRRSSADRSCCIMEEFERTESRCRRSRPSCGN